MNYFFVASHIISPSLPLSLSPSSCQKEGSFIVIVALSRKSIRDSDTQKANNSLLQKSNPPPLHHETVNHFDLPFCTNTIEHIYVRSYARLRLKECKCIGKLLSSNDSFAGVYILAIFHFISSKCVEENRQAVEI